MRTSTNIHPWTETLQSQHGTTESSHMGRKQILRNETIHIRDHGPAEHQRLRMQDNCLLPSRRLQMNGESGGGYHSTRHDLPWPRKQTLSPGLAGKRGCGGPSGAATAPLHLEDGWGSHSQGLGGRGEGSSSLSPLKGLGQRRLLIRFVFQKTPSGCSVKNESEAYNCADRSGYETVVGTKHLN